MPQITFNEARIYILKSFFQNSPEALGPFYVGLGTGSASRLDQTLDDIQPMEITGTNYSRKPIYRDASPQGWQVLGEDIVQTPELEFENTGFECWQEFSFAFLTLSPSDLSEPKLLISAVDFKNSVILKPKQKFKFQFRFRLQNLTKDYPIIHTASIDLAAFAQVPPATAVVI